MNERRTSGRGRGFTLIEIMVALTGGLFFTIFVFMLTKDVTRFFQQESRLSDTTLTAITGFERLRADVARAGFLASPNLAKDTGRCPPRDPGGAITSGFSANWAANASALQKMGILRVDATAAAISANPLLTMNSLTPDTLTLFGNYTSSEQFPARSVQPSGANVLVYLDPTSGAMARIGFTTASTAANQTLLDTVFPSGRALRLVNQENEEQYGIITSVTNGASPTITLGPGLAIVNKGAGSVCGLRGFAGGVQVNTVNIIRYELANLSADANFSYVFAGVRPATDTTPQRLEFARSEILPNDTIAAGSTELVAEYAVDFKVGVSVVSNPGTVQTSFYPTGDSNIPAYAGDPLSATAAALGKGPHLIRAAHVRLSVRALDGDRDANVAAADLGTVPYRVQLIAAAGSTPAKFARVRSLQALIATRNSRNKLWN